MAKSAFEKLYGYNPFAGKKIQNFRRDVEIWGTNINFVLKLDKNNQVFEVLAGPYTVSKKGRRFFEGTPTRVRGLFDRIKGRPYSDYLKEIIAEYDLPVEAEEKL